MFAPFPQILNKLLLWNALRNMQTSQEYFTTTVDAKFWGTQSELCGIEKKKRIEQAGYFLSQFNDTHSDFWLVEGVLEIWLD